MARIAHNALETRRVNKLTDALAKSLPSPAVGIVKAKYWIYWDESESNFGLQVYESGKRSWILQCYGPDKKQVKRVLGNANADDIRYMKVRDAIVEKRKQEGMILGGKDQVKLDKKARHEKKAIQVMVAEQQKVDAETLAVVLREYVDKKRKSGGLLLKERTKADYLAMIKAGGFKVNGDKKTDGELYGLANKPIKSITGDDIRSIYSELQKRGRGKERRATYAMQVLRAVMNWSGIKIADNPLSKEVAGRNRIVLAGSKQSPNPISPDYIGKWWHEATKASMDTNGIDSADYLRFKLLTGCRGVEIKGDAFGNKPIRVRDVDLTSGRIILQDTKNRQEHTLLLSTQALEIAKKKASGKKPNDLLFNIKYPRRMLMTINRETGLSETAHDEHSLRDTFASIADELVSQYTLKKMINHSSSSDVTGHYVGKGEGQLRAGWQAVADFIEEQAKPFSRSLI